MKFFAILLGLHILTIASVSVYADEEQQAVLVTGASSGIGLRITEVLSSNGYLVYAGARKEADLKRLQTMPNVESVRLDVTVQSDIDAAVNLISTRGLGLYGLINNAGITMAGPLVEVPVAELEWLFNVNVYGPYRMTQAFAPLIIESKGRIVTIGSVLGIFSGSMSGHYSMSKHAMEAFTDSLAAEMERFGVNVSLIEPGTYASNAGKAASERLEEKAYWSESSAYKNEFIFLKLAQSRGSSGKDPEDVAKAVMQALSADRPKRRYMVVPDASTANMTISKAIDRMLELNQEQAYSMSREQLVEIIDRKLKKPN